jgi:hypothetical protein
LTDDLPVLSFGGMGTALSRFRKMPALLAVGGIVLVWLSAVPPASAEEEIYKYLDDAGTLNFTSDWGSVPDKYRHTAERLHPSPTVPPAVPATPKLPPDVRTVQAVGEHRMGDHDTRYDAERLAVEAAKRNALEQVATHVESVTVANNLDLTRDEIRSYTAGLVLVQNQQITTRLDGNDITIHAELTAQIDANEVVEAIDALRANDDARVELAALKQENDQLQSQLTSVNAQLAGAADPQQAQLLAQERQGLLDQAQSNALISQAWTDYLIAQRVTAPYPWFVVGQARSLLWQAWNLRPKNPHLPAVQRAIAPQAVVPVPVPSFSQSPHPNRSQPPTWPTGRAFSPPNRTGAPPPNLPPTIHQFHPLPPQPITRQPFKMAPAPGRHLSPRGEGGPRRGGGGRQR